MASSPIKPRDGAGSCSRTLLRRQPGCPAHHGRCRMKFTHLRYVLAVAERGSVRAAARQLGVAQSALTRSIGELEKELGVMLFQRGIKGTQLTTLGERFVRRANTIRAEMGRVRDEMTQLRGAPQGSINIAMSSVPHLAFLPTVLPQFTKQYPDVLVEIREALFRTIETDLRDGVFDCYIGPLPKLLALDGLVSEKLFDNNRMILGRKNHPLAGARSLRELSSARWITTFITDRAEEELVPMFTKFGLPPPTIAMHAQSTLTIIISVAYTDLLVMLPMQWTEFPFARHVLEKINVIESLPAPSIYIVRRTDIPMTPAVEYFCDLMRRASGPAARAASPVLSDSARGVSKRSPSTRIRNK